MARSELTRDFEALMKKIKVQKDVFIKMVESVDHKKAVDDGSVYECFLPTLEVFQNELDNMQSVIFNEIQEICDKLMAMYDEIEKQSTLLYPEESDDLVDDEKDDGKDDEFTDEEVSEFEREAEEFDKQSNSTDE